MQNKGKLIVFSAPSGAGKTTIVKRLLREVEGLAFSISATTRAPRDGEMDGIDYYFLSEDDFKLKIANNEFVEYEEVYERTYYGTLRSELERIWALDKYVVFDIDVEGGLTIKEKYKENTLSIFVQAPTLEELEHRLRARQTDSEAKLKERIAKAQQETLYKDKFDVILKNENLEVAIEGAKRIITAFLNKG